MERVWKPDGSIEQRLFLGDFAMVTLTTQGGTTTGATRYLHHDHLGSIDAITGAGGSLIERLSFDAWGKRRQSTWLPMAGTSGLQSFSPNLTQGYTGHEMLDPVGLIHMNGRVYDPEIGRFLSADPFVQDISSLQAWNRYSYVLNNPLSMTDPSGFFFGSIAKFMGNLFGEIINAIGSVFKAVLNVPILRAAIQVIACSVTTAAGCVAVTGAIALAAGGSIMDALQAMAFSATSYGVWTGVGKFITGPLGEALGNGLDFAAAKGAIHGAVGGGLSVAQGGSFLNGFIGNAVGAGVGEFSDSVSNGHLVVDTVIVAAAGGTASALTGGKFANGAVTAAFANLWNKHGRWSAFRDAAQMAFGWALGMGPTHQAFGPGSAQVEELMDAPGTNAAREAFYAKNAGAIARGDSSAIQPVTDFAASFGFGGYFSAWYHLNSTRHFVGSYAVEIYPTQGGRAMQFSLANTSSFTSFAYGAGPNWERSGFAPASNFRQRYYWTESIGGF